MQRPNFFSQSRGTHHRLLHPRIDLGMERARHNHNRLGVHAPGGLGQYQIHRRRINFMTNEGGYLKAMYG